MLQFLLRWAAAFRKKAIRKLRRRKLKAISKGEALVARKAAETIQTAATDILRIVAQTHGDEPKTWTGAYVQAGSSTSDDEPTIIIFDLKGGGHCYYIDPPGVCCCDPC